MTTEAQAALVDAGSDRRHRQKPKRTEPVRIRLETAKSEYRRRRSRRRQSRVDLLARDRVEFPILPTVARILLLVARVKIDIFLRLVLLSAVVLAPVAPFMLEMMRRLSAASINLRLSLLIVRKHPPVRTPHFKAPLGVLDLNLLHATSNVVVAVISISAVARRRRTLVRRPIALLPPLRVWAIGSVGVRDASHGIILLPVAARRLHLSTRANHQQSHERSGGLLLLVSPESPRRVETPAWAWRGLAVKLIVAELAAD